MTVATIHIKDEINIIVKGLSIADYSELSNIFAVYAKGFRHQARYKLGHWDGKIRFCDKQGKTYVRLLPEILNFLRIRKYGIKLVDDRAKYNLTVQPIDNQYFQYRGIDITLGDHQVRGVNALLSEAGGIFEGGTGSGKAQPLYSKVLTPSGWKQMGDIKKGDLVINPVNGLPITVLDIFPQGEKDIFELTFKDSSKARACAEHLWKVKIPRILTKPERVNKLVSTMELKEFLKRKKEYKYSSRNVTIPLSSPIEFPEKKVEIDPYILGLLLGDGGLSKSIIFSSADDFLVEEMRRYVESHENLKIVHRPGTYDYAISKKYHTRSQKYANVLLKSLQKLGLHGLTSHYKFIPDCYKYGSIEQRFSIVQGLMDTDGSGGSCSYSTVSEQLALDLQEICWSLGMVCSKNIKRGRYKGEVHLSYRLTIGHTCPRDLFRLPRKKEQSRKQWGNGFNDELSRQLVSVDFVGVEEAQCILVDSEDHLYITDDYTVTHNTLMTAVLALLYEEERKLRTIIIVPTSDLIDQTYDELTRVGVDVGVYGGTKKDIDHKHLVSTWQSLQNNKGLIGQYHIVIVDECHGVSGLVLQEILNKHGARCRVRMGLTGTLPEEDIDKMAVRVTMGDVVEGVEASELIAVGWLAELHLYCYSLVEDLRPEYHKFCEENPIDAAKLTYRKFKSEYFKDYIAEKKYIQKRPERLQMLANLIAKPLGNTLVLLPNIAFGRAITKLVPNAVFFYGADSKAVRKELYNSFEEEDDVIAITTYSLGSTGLNIKRIFNLFLIDPGKSYVQVIQSIGRGLRKAFDKMRVNVYDIHSDLKFSRRHANIRKKHYKNKKYPYKETKVDYMELIGEL